MDEGLHVVGGDVENRQLYGFHAPIFECVTTEFRAGTLRGECGCKRAGGASRAPCHGPRAGPLRARATPRSPGVIRRGKTGDGAVRRIHPGAVRERRRTTRAVTPGSGTLR